MEKIKYHNTKCTSALQPANYCKSKQNKASGLASFVCNANDLYLSAFPLCSRAEGSRSASLTSITNVSL